MNIGIIGIGAWGKKLLSIFNKISKVHSCACYDKIKNLDWFEKNYPDIVLTENYKDILNDKLIDAVIVATPIKTHFKIVKESIKANKHVFVEKPISQTGKEALELINLKTANIIFINHIFLFNSCFEFLKNFCYITTTAVKFWYSNHKVLPFFNFCVNL